MALLSPGHIFLQKVRLLLEIPLYGLFFESIRMSLGTFCVVLSSLCRKFPIQETASRHLLFCRYYLR